MERSGISGSLMIIRNGIQSVAVYEQQ